MDLELYKKLAFLVKEEADNLRKYATVDELSQLSMQYLDHNNNYNCIYGQISGDCESGRALELINKCCSKRVSVGLDFVDEVRGYNISDGRRIKNYLFSPIEVFLWYAIYSDIALLVGYLRKENELDIDNFSYYRWRYYDLEEIGERV